jgi:hypothetical protein
LLSRWPREYSRPTVQEIEGGTRDTEPIAADEIADVVRHDGLTLSCNRQLEHQIVPWIGKKWSPEIEDLLQVSDLAKVVQDRIGLLRTQSGDIGMPQDGILVLEEQRD